MIFRFALFFVAFILSFEANSQINFIEIDDRSASELNILKYLEINSRNLSSIICFLDTADIGYKYSSLDIKKKSQEFTGQLYFLIVKFNSRSRENLELKFFGYKIQESQFYIKSELFGILDQSSGVYDNSYSNLPLEIKKIDLTQCQKDKKMSTLLTSSLFPAIADIAKSTQNHKKELVLLQKNLILESNIKQVEKTVLAYRNSLDSLSKLFSNLKIDFKENKSSVDKKYESSRDVYLSVDIKSNFINDIFSNSFSKIVVGFNLIDTDTKKCKFSLNFGVQQSSDFWNKGNFQNQVLSLYNPNQQLDELLVSSSNVKENYNLSATSAVIGFDLKHYLGKSKAYTGIYGNLVKPIIYNLSFANTSGEFDYVGVSNAIQEPLTNIPELGLVSGVSYVGNKSDLEGKLKTFYDFGAMFGYSIGERSPVDINFSLGLTTSKKFDLLQSNSAISSSYGEYNSIATINSTQISVPRFWNLGFSVRKYLN